MEATPTWTVLRRRDYALFWSGQLISKVGNWVFWIALPFYVYRRTGSALATGIMLIVKDMPPLLLGSLAGVLVDCWDQKGVVVACSLLQALVMLLLLLPGGIWLVYLALLGQSLIALFAHPALGALVPRLVGEDELMAANNVDAFGGNLASLVGPALGGLLSGHLGLPGAVWVRSATLLVSAALIGLLSPLPGPDRAPTGQDLASDQVRRSVWRDLRAGLRLVRRDRILGALFAIAGVIMFGQGIVNVLWAVFVRDVLGGGEVEYGWVQVAVAAGALVGGPVLAYASQRLSTGRLIAVSGAFVGLLMLATFNVPWLPAILALQFLAGIPAVCFSVPQRTLLQASTDDRYLGRVLGALNTTNALLTLGGQVLASALGDRVGIVPLLNLAGWLYLPGAIIPLVTMAPRPRHRPGDRSAGPGVDRGACPGAGRSPRG